MTIRCGNLWSTVQIDDKNSLKLVRDALTYKVPGAEFTQAYKNHVWDGTRTLLEGIGTNTYRFPTGLVERVAGVLGCGWESNGFTPSKLRKTFPNARFTLRPYQTQAVLTLLSSSKPRMGGLLQAATGAGKTMMAAKLIQSMGKRTLVLTHTKDLLRQTADELSRWLGEPVGVYGGGKKQTDHWVTVATVQSLQRGGDELLHSTDFAVFDEAHHVAAQTIYDLLYRMPNVSSVVGLSASPWRDDGLDLLLEAVCGPVRHRIRATDLIEQGWLVPPHIAVHKIPVEKEFRNVRGSVSEYQGLYQTLVVNHHGRHQYIANIARAHIREGRVVLVLVRNIDHGHALRQYIPGAFFMEGDTPAAERKQILDQVRQRQQRVLIATSLADEGVDLPSVDVVILAGAGASTTRALQRIGRALRPYPGKTEAFIEELVDQHPSFQKQWYDRKRVYASEPAFTLREIAASVGPRIATVAAT